MYHTIRIAAALLLGVVVAAPAWAKDPDRPIIFQSGDVIGKYVKNPQGETLGNIEDFVVDKDGNIVYIAVAVGETAGFGGRLYAVPPDGLALEPGLQYFVLNAKKTDLDVDKGFDANRWPTKADARWGKNSKATNDRKDDGDAKERVHRVSKIKGMTVKNPRGETLGRIYEVVLDMEDNKVAYCALSTGGVLGVGAKLFAIPCNAFETKSLTLNPADRSLVLDATKQDFEAATGFDTSRWPPRADERWKKK
jgi:sporulation protein YlmC with PRC-barrel domain